MEPTRRKGNPAKIHLFRQESTSFAGKGGVVSEGSGHTTAKQTACSTAAHSIQEKLWAMQNESNDTRKHGVPWPNRLT